MEMEKEKEKTQEGKHVWDRLEEEERRAALAEALQRVSVAAYQAAAAAGAGATAGSGDGTAGEAAGEETVEGEYKEV